MFKDTLKQLRQKNGYTQKELAKLINSSVSKIGMWETGQREPVKEDLTILAEIFEVPVDYLIGDTNTEVLEISKKIEALPPEVLEALQGYFRLDDDKREIINKLIQSLDIEKE